MTALGMSEPAHWSTVWCSFAVDFDFAVFLENSFFKQKNKCVTRLARRIPHHMALSNAATPNSQCLPTVAAAVRPSGPVG